MLADASLGISACSLPIVRFCIGPGCTLRGGFVRLVDSGLRDEEPEIVASGSPRNFSKTKLLYGIEVSRQSRRVLIRSSEWL